MTRWVGIDEAGYGPNLGPLVMSAVVAEGPGDRPPDLWGDLAATVARAGERDCRLWVDDSKKLYRGGVGLERLETACLVTLAASGREPPATLGGLLAALDAGSAAEAELTPWLEIGEDPPVPRAQTRPMLERAMAQDPFEGAPWRVVGVRTVVIGPERFNRGLAESRSKAEVHFDAFRRLLQRIWETAADGVSTQVRSDKHGGRHFYFEPLSRAFPDTWIDRGAEGPSSSQYTLRAEGRRLELALQPRADADDGLVALASIVSKTVRELWMAAFNAHWIGRIPGLRPTAGYPGDAARFREAIEPACRARGLHPDQYWRIK